MKRAQRHHPPGPARPTINTPILMTDPTSNTTQANHGDPEDPNTYGLCRCCEVRPVALPCDDLCPVCEANETGIDEFTHEVGF